MTRMKKIKELPSCERPREKLAKGGPEKLSLEELIAVILGSGTAKKNVRELAQKTAFLITGKREELAFQDLCGVLGPVKASQIFACLEIGKRIYLGKKDRMVFTPLDVWKLLGEFHDRKKEFFILIYLDTKNQAIRKEVISIGTLNASLIHPREVFEPAIRNYACQVVIAHNHPSGNLEPSAEDVELTDRLGKAGELLGIPVADHLIFSGSGYFSFKEKGLIR